MTDPSSPRVLVATADLGGNVPPALGIAARLAADGSAVHVLGHQRQEAAATALGLPFSGYTHDGGYDPLKPRSALSTIRDLTGLACDRGLAADVLGAAAREGSDLLLVDCMLLAALRAGARSAIPTVALVHSFPDFFTGRWAHGPIGGLASLRGFRPNKVWRALAGAVTTSLPELAGTSTALGGPVVGPVWQGTPRPSTPRTGRPRVLVSLSSIWWPGQDATAQRLLDALGGLDVDAVFTTGPALNRDTLSAPANVELRPWVDHGDLMPDVDLVISHGGHSTVMRALSYDLPMLLIPMHPMVDQPTVARVIAEHGAGRTLPRTADAADIRNAIQQLTTERSYRTAAAALGARIRAKDGAATAGDYLRTLASRPRNQSMPA